MPGSGEFLSAGGRLVRWAATGRSGGVSAAPYDSLNLGEHVGDAPDAVAGNRARAAALVGANPASLSVLGAAHGGRVAVAAVPGPLPGCDGAVTTVPGLALLALAADCVPVALADPDAGVVGVAHCGWRGLIAGIVPATVAAMRDLGAEQIEAVLGPSICAACYGVPEERLRQLADEAEPEVAAAAAVTAGSAAIDVAAGVRAALDTAGVRHRTLAGCTAEDPTLFSYRRDGVTGRQGMIVVR